MSGSFWRSRTRMMPPSQRGRLGRNDPLRRRSRHHEHRSVDTCRAYYVALFRARSEWMAPIFNRKDLAVLGHEI
jgi:hypothetical protein